ncbi:MAG: branched-chain-amino-acid transaminase [bacterium]
MKIWIDGKFYDKEDAKISVFDHCVLYGDGVFEGIRVYDGCIFRLRQHLERLWESAKYIMLKIPMTVDEMRKAVVETVRANEVRNAYIRLVVTRGVGDLGLNPQICPRPTVFIIAANITIYQPEDYEKGLEIITATTRRYNVGSFNGRVKSCNYLNNVMAKIEGLVAGVRESLMLDDRGYVVECAADNVFVVKNDILYTAPDYLGALRGITRDCVIEIAGNLGYKVREEPFTRFEVYNAGEVFLTGTAAEAIPVTMVDQRIIGNGKPGPITKRLIDEFRKIVTTDGEMVY